VVRPRIAAVALAVAALLATRLGRAEPQWSAGALASGCLLGGADDPFQRVAFCGALRGDLLLGRERTADFGFGPYVSLGTAAFDDLRLAVGGSALAPVLEDFPLVISLGALVRDGSAFGADANLFWGIRSYNFHATWNFAAGLVLGAQRTFGNSAENVVSLGLQIDGLVFALPVLLLAGAAGGN